MKTAGLYTLIGIKLFVVLVLHQPQGSSCMEIAASDVGLPVEMTGWNMRPVVVLETLNLSR